MAWRCSGRTNEELIENIIKAQILSSKKDDLERISNAMKAVDRSHFVPDKSAAYSDSPHCVCVFGGSGILKRSQGDRPRCNHKRASYGLQPLSPRVHNLMLKSQHAHAVDHLLPFLRPGAKVLDIGSGSGYLSAVLHHLVSSYESEKVVVPGKVVGIEHIPELADWSLQNLKREDRTRRAVEAKEVEIHVGDGRLGYPSEGPYDAIHVGAASPTIPEPLVAQLAKPGRMFIPVGNLSQHIMQVDKDAEGNVTETRIMAVSYVPLTDRDKQKAW